MRYKLSAKTKLMQTLDKLRKYDQKREHSIIEAVTVAVLAAKIVWYSFVVQYKG